MNAKGRLCKGGEKPCILKAGAGGIRRTQPATGPARPAQPDPQVRGSRALPRPRGRALPRQPTRSGVHQSVRPSVRPPRGVPARLTWCAIPAAASAPASGRGARRPLPRPQVAARLSATPAAAVQGSAREKAGPGAPTQRRGARGRARPAPSLASREGWSRFRPETPASALAGRRRGLHFPEGAAARAAWLNPSPPHPGPREAARRGWTLGPAWWPVYGGLARVYASVRPSTLPSIHPSILASNIY